jgi:antitoxin MazE
MTVTIARWGNSLAVRLPKDALERAALREGDVLDIVSDNGVITLLPHQAPETLEDLIERITPANLHTAEFDLVAGAETW